MDLIIESNHTVVFWALDLVRPLARAELPVSTLSPRPYINTVIYLLYCRVGLEKHLLFGHMALPKNWWGHAHVLLSLHAKWLQTLLAVLHRCILMDSQLARWVSLHRLWLYEYRSSLVLQQYSFWEGHVLEGVTLEFQISFFDEGTGGSLHCWHRRSDRHRGNGWSDRLALNLLLQLAWHSWQYRFGSLIWEWLRRFINVLLAASHRLFVLNYLHLFQFDSLKVLLISWAFLLSLSLALITFFRVIGVVIHGFSLLLFIVEHFQVLLELAHDIKGWIKANGSHRGCLRGFSVGATWPAWLAWAAPLSNENLRDNSLYFLVVEIGVFNRNRITLEVVGDFARFPLPLPWLHALLFLFF